MKLRDFLFASVASLTVHAALAGSLSIPWLGRAAGEGSFLVAQIDAIPKNFAKEKTMESGEIRLPRRGIKADWAVSSPKHAPRPPEPIQAKTLLTDPLKGQVFSAYFGGVKDKINRTLRRKAGQKPYDGGDVEVFFVLRADGSLERFWTASNSLASQALENFSLSCLQGAAPFSPFPKELGVQQIAFNISLVFEEY